MSENSSSANDFNEMRRQKSENARKQREITAKLEREKLEAEKNNSTERIENIYKNIKQSKEAESQKQKFITASELLILSNEAIMDLYDTRTNFIERRLLAVEIKNRIGKEQ